MQVNGEAYFLINVWMNFLSLYLAGALCRRRIQGKKCLIAAALGGIYALLAWEFPLFRALPFLVCTSWLMALLAFGRHFSRPLPLLLGAGFLLSGVSSYLMEHSITGPWLLLSAGAFSLLIIHAFRRFHVSGQGKKRLMIFHRGKQISLPAFRDSGNLLSDPITALPVIVAPISLLTPLLPPGINPRDLSTLPPGFHLIPIQTAGGKRTLMAFHPENIQLLMGNSACFIDAMIAHSDFSENRALLPEAIFHQEGIQNACL